MSLQRLPPETLLHILQLLGPAFFRDDVGRLLVSKHWYHLARPVLLQDLVFSTKSLPIFAAASKRAETVPAIQPHVKTVSVRLDSIRDWWSPRGDGTGLPFPCEEDIDYDKFHAWLVLTNISLAALGDVLHLCPRLRSLRLEALGHGGSLHMATTRFSLGAEYVVSLVSVSHLTCLEVDTDGVETRSSIVDPSRVHLCCELNALLPTLRRFRYRMWQVCPLILEAPANGQLLRLDDVVINLCVSRGGSWFDEPVYCRQHPFTDTRRYAADIRDRARELAQRLEQPSVVRVLSPGLFGRSMVSYDALTGRHMRLSSTAPWDADGDEVEEHEETIGNEPYLTGDLFGEDDASTTSEPEESVL